MGGIRGRLISASFAEQVLPALPDFTPPPQATLTALDAWAERCEAALGPASSVRAVADVSVLPLLRLLGFEIAKRDDSPAECRMATTASGRPGPAIVVAAWKQPLAQQWRHAVLRSIAVDAHWCFCCNGTALRIVDARRTWCREFVEFDLALMPRDSRAAAVLWTVARADAFAGPTPAIDRLAALSAAYTGQVCKSLGHGVLEALTLLMQSVPPRRAVGVDRALLFEQSLTVLYRVLFMLFAEARGLVPLWHAVYRDRYSLDAIVTTLLAGRSYRGLWQALEAISRVAHSGCQAGELKVTAFNGRLFSPQQAATLAQVAIDDDVIGRVVRAVSTTTAGGRESRRRIAYRDLDVEQLGAVYEQVLDYQPGSPASRGVLQPTGDLRKSSGTFYTPRAVTACLVRQTLEPLVRERTAAQIIALRIVDPAMGSGAFLVGACRYLAQAVEEALVREGQWQAGDVTALERTLLRREIASRCLYGVDLNPMAVQLARLSLWLATLASDRPLSFLDHRLVAGDSLIGATLDDVLRQPGGSGRARRVERLPLFEEAHLAGALERAISVRQQLAAEADESATIVRRKERVFAALQAPGAEVERWSRLFDLWCAGWFWGDGRGPDAATARELGAQILGSRSVLPPHISGPLLDAAARVTATHRFLHWHLTFPEIFADPAGHPLPAAGFDAILGNPPWDMVRGDSGKADVRIDRRRQARQITAFAREAGIYRVDGAAHVNRYQLFVERALQLVRPGGRIGFVLPSGIISDAGAAALRRHLFDRADVDRVTGLDNRTAIFPIHRSVRFVLLTCTAGQPTRAVACRFGITRPRDLDEDEGMARPPIMITRALLSHLSGDDDLGMPEVSTERDLRIVERISAQVPWLSAAAGWHVRFGRELNASDDRSLFAPFSGAAAARPVIEGKQIEPFRVAVDRSRFELTPAAARDSRVPRQPRVAYRDVASATNRLTLIAAIIPAHAVTTHTLFCLKTPLPLARQRVLCALLNSFVANYLIRLRVTTHVTVSLVSRLPVPLVADRSPAHARLAALSVALTESDGPVEDQDAYVELQAIAAKLYHLTADDFEHVLGTFPLIGKDVRRAALQRFNTFE